MGTSLEILCQYLAYHPEAEHVNSNGTHRVKVVSVDVDAESVYCRELTGGGEWTLNPSELKLVLHPFVDLVKQLPNGAVPAIEVAKLALVLAPENGSPTSRFYVDPASRAEPYISVIAKRERTYDLEIILRPDWSVGLIYDWATVPGNNGGAVWDYLRSLHFAVGLEPHQYVRKTL